MDPQDTFVLLQNVATARSWTVVDNAYGSVTITRGNDEVTLAGISSNGQLTYTNIYECSIRFSQARYAFWKDKTEIITYNPETTNPIAYATAISEITTLFD